MNNILSLAALVRDGQMRSLAGPMLIIMILSMMVLPLPPFVLDVLFTFNIALAVIVLLVSLYSRDALEFAVFPTVLLITTLLRLSLNVASTRVVLMHGHNGPDAAGKVIEAFGHFLVGGNYAVGLVVFIILIVINFVVITKGAGRIAEVSARFTLDAIPGKQMAIDADLNAGLIREDEARKRRERVAQEANFYGSMDGASKFVRGDAIAGILIMLITIIGGLIVGVLQHDMNMGDAAKNYTLLTIGDGLVAQIPALIISTAAGLVVSRVSTDEDLGQQFVSQLLNKPQALWLTAGILGALGLVPGMPNFVFLLLAGMIGTLAYYVSSRATSSDAKLEEPEVVTTETQDASWEDVVQVDTLGLEVGYRLIPLVDKHRQGDLLKRINSIRKKFAQEIGFLPPVVHIRDNLELRPNGYRITMKGSVIGQGESYNGMHLAINPGEVTMALPGNRTEDPAFGLPAVWIETEQRELAQTSGYTVVDASTVVTTHLNHLIRMHASELLGREELQKLLDHLGQRIPKLTDDLIPKLLPLATVQKILQHLLEEGVNIRDMRTIIDTLTEHAGRTQDVSELLALVRVALGRMIVEQCFPSDAEMQVMSLHPELENILIQVVQSDPVADGGIEPGLADTLTREASSSVKRLEQLGLPVVLVVPDAIRLLLSRFLRRSLPQLRVLAHSEIPDTRKIKFISIIGGNKK
ncbi:flagellar biosynthesis protein FlhA [Nitrosomonas eutropha]|uniref:Flagellar biosynthesis protein FlhA n=2 Tax=Nitrosomonas eutropha TaxID=916 RepID=A0ABX5M7Y9_9PROT|nr:flagellar biosynthesis protein FlhA [Nitrosomonas eutropha]ABI60653.1 flagellar biosynthesis protein FlhA [Nitrosomonas eutropha C91]PXV77288.1 flagellar biosynthesis protein FlhA [Nitrosomonas eutropha]SEJ15588.1 flagellar biosynthesis protein FlhA [Nitrosomonas eutropha]